MAILDTLNFEGLEEGSVLDTAAVGGTLSAWSVNSTTTNIIVRGQAAAHGARGIRITNPDSVANVTWMEAGAVAVSAQRCVSFYFRIDDSAAIQSYIGNVTNGLGVGSAVASWRINPDLTVSIRDQQVATGSPGNSTLEALSEDVYYRCEWMLRTNGTQEIRIYIGDSTVPYLSREGDLTANLHDRIQVGIPSSPAPHILSFDSIRIADDWTGPFGAPETPLPTPTGFTLVAHPGPSVVQMTASWNAVGGAANYQVEVQRLQNGVWLAFNTFTTSGTQLVLGVNNGLVQGTTYRARVRAMP